MVQRFQLHILQIRFSFCLFLEMNRDSFYVEVSVILRWWYCHPAEHFFLQPKQSCSSMNDEKEMIVKEHDYAPNIVVWFSCIVLPRCHE